MKKTLLFSVALAGLMLGSCSSSDDLNGGGNNTGSNQSGDGYVAFTINMPSQPASSSRAFDSSNDQFNDGMAKEYAVKNATLLLFDGADDNSATFVAAYKLSTEPWKDLAPSDDNITTQSRKIVQKVTASINKAKALVILNDNGILTVDDTHNSLKVNGTSFTGTFADFVAKADATDGKDFTKDGFYMANAPLANNAGGSTAPATGTKVTTLTDLTGKIYDSELAAKTGDPAEVYVERGVAKVTVNKGTVNKADNGTPTKVPFEVTGWAIDNYNPTTYLVRSTDGFDSWMGYANERVTANPYRFVGHTEVAAGLYRTYFAKDVNYDTDASTVLKRATDFKDAYGDKNPQYCFENTFDVGHQNENQTTLATIKAKLNGGTSFYILGGDQTTLYTEDVLKTLVAGKFMTVEEAWLKANGKAGEEITTSDITVSLDTTDPTHVEVTGITVADSKLADPTKVAYPSLNDVKAAVGTITYYKNGESYYTIRIKHFGDQLTPWEKGQLGVAEGNIYPDGTKKTAEKNWLGRYGVLRNNWYDITVEGVKGLGSPINPKLTPTTDDELESYIAVRINVLSWAKRTQGATLH
ncbi:fimbria major subunit [Segatella copri]|uniref:fimbria major subunit n=1 Tax=Segatella copri TaxID=165179 RepID=UPI0012912855|nr:fimbria major subunit [Segatella copri]MQN36430.1 hypothetical protein [Segatella copri]MQO30993.1 hypothetical protein [Segatella copri]MQO43381.1 hypothetical protein [Segatella copri]